MKAFQYASLAATFLVSQIGYVNARPADGNEYPPITETTSTTTIQDVSTSVETPETTACPTLCVDYICGGGGCYDICTGTRPTQSPCPSTLITSTTSCEERTSAHDDSSTEPTPTTTMLLQAAQEHLVVVTPTPEASFVEPTTGPCAELIQCIDFATDCKSGPIRYGGCFTKIDSACNTHKHPYTAPPCPTRSA